MKVRIIGDGVAGTLVAHALTSRGHDVSVVGSRQVPARGVTALVHPFAGRSVELPDVEERAWLAAQPLLQQFLAQGVARRVPMVRPLIGDAGVRLERSFDRVSEAFRASWGLAVEEHPTLGRSLVYEDCYGIDMRTALETLRSDLRYELVEPDVTVLAPGHELAQWVEGDDVRAFGGQLAVLSAGLENAVSGGGVHVVPTMDGRACAGSTWWDPEAPVADEAAAADLQGRYHALFGTCPAIEQVWQGFRCVYQPDRRPVVGFLDDHFAVAGALGTRGWLWAPWVAQQIADAVDGKPVASELDVARTTLVRKPTAAG